MGGAVKAIETGALKSEARRIQHPPPRGDRARRADRRRRQRLHQFRALAADGGRELDPRSLRRGRGRAGRAARGLAGRARRSARARGAQGAARGRGDRRATSCRRRSRRPRPASPPANGATRSGRSSASSAPRPASRRARGRRRQGLDALRGEVERVSLKLGRRIKFLLGKPGLDGHSNGAEQIAGARHRRRHGGGLRRHPPHARRHRRARQGRASIASGCRSCRARTSPSPRRCCELMREAGLERVPLIVGGIIPPADAERLKRGGRRGRLHAEGFRDQHDARRDRQGDRGASRPGARPQSRLRSLDAPPLRRGSQRADEQQDAGDDRASPST